MNANRTPEKTPRLPRLNPPGAYWHVLQVGPMRHLPAERGKMDADDFAAMVDRLKGIETRIRDAGFEVFCPREVHRVRHARTVETVLRPYFPGYLFVKFDVARDGWQDIVHLPGARAFLANPAGVPLQMPYGLVERMLRAVDAAGVMPGPKGGRRRDAPRFGRGQKVRVVGGPFSGFPGEIEGVLPEDRFKALIEIFGRATAVELEGVDLEGT